MAIYVDYSVIKLENKTTRDYILQRWYPRYLDKWYIPRFIRSVQVQYIIVN